VCGFPLSVHEKIIFLEVPFKGPLIHVSEAAKPKAKIREKAQFMGGK